MTPFLIAKLVELATTLRTRKRLQKVVYLLQASGLEAFDADFILHRFGPYSPEVAALTDQMSSQGLLEERSQPNSAGVEYSYRLTDKAKQLIQKLEGSPDVSKIVSMRGFEQKATQLLQASLADLEFGATIVYFFREVKDWDKATEMTCEFKKLQRGSEAIRRALAFAQSTIKRSAVGAENGIKASENI